MKSENKMTLTGIEPVTSSVQDKQCKGSIITARLQRHKYINLADLLYNLFYLQSGSPENEQVFISPQEHFFPLTSTGSPQLQKNSTFHVTTAKATTWLPQLSFEYLLWATRRVGTSERL